MATFGYTSIGATDNAATVPQGSKFTAPASGTITDIQVYVSNTGTSGTPMRAAVYADASGSPGAKLAESAEVNNTPLAWNALSLSLAITNATVYWLMVWSTDTGIRYDTPGDVSDQSAYQTGLTYPSWPDPFVKDAFLDWKVSIYATYTPSGGSARPVKLSGNSGGFAGDSGGFAA